MRDYLVALYRVRVLNPKGHVCRCLYHREGGRKVLPLFGGFLASSAAYLATTRFDGNEFYQNDEVFRLALDAGDRLLLDHAAITSDTKPNHFQIYPLAKLYALLGGTVDKVRRDRWRETMERNLKAVDALIDRTGENLGKPGPWAGTGPNHYFGWFAVGYEQAQLLGESRIASKIEKAMLRHLAVQSPAGYFPEYKGPATGYQHVSLGGLAEYHRLNPLPQTKKAIENGLSYVLGAMYPDFRGIETFDERNRLGHDPRFGHALLWTPAGRNVFARTLALARKDVQRKPGCCKPFVDAVPFTMAELYAVGAAFRCYEHAVATRRIGVAKELPLDRDAFAWKLEDKGLVRKQGPWFYALSAYVHDAPQGNPYHLDRTQALSVYHECAGLIIGGGNDKRAYHAATVHVREGGDCHYFPAMATRLLAGASARVLSGKGKCDHVEFDFGSVIAQLEVRAESPTRFRIGLGATSTQTKPQVWLVLQLPVRAPLKLDNDGVPLVLKKAQEGQAEEEHELGRSLGSSEGWRMSLPRGSSLVWPHIPWNPYRPPSYLDFPEMAVALVRVPLHMSGMRAEVTLSVAGV